MPVVTVFSCARQNCCSWHCHCDSVSIVSPTSLCSKLSTITPFSVLGLENFSIHRLHHNTHPNSSGVQVAEAYKAAGTNWKLSTTQREGLEMLMERGGLISLCLLAPSLSIAQWKLLRFRRRNIGRVCKAQFQAFGARAHGSGRGGERRTPSAQDTATHPASSW